MMVRERVRLLVVVGERFVERWFFPRALSVVGMLRCLSQMEISQEMLATSRLRYL